MKLKELIEILDGEILVGDSNPESEIESACSADMMSDVLAFSHNHSALLTGLCNTQVIRTAEMMDINYIIIVRGKTATEEMKAMAVERGITLISTRLMMYVASGLLYSHGLTGGGYND